MIHILEMSAILPSAIREVVTELLSGDVGDDASVEAETEI